MIDLLGFTFTGELWRSAQQPWPASRSEDCVRRTSSHDDVRQAPSSPAAAAAGGGRAGAAWPTPPPPAGHSRETVPISVPCSDSKGYDLPAPWSPIYTDEVIESSSASSSSSSSSECGVTPPVHMQQTMCRHERERESERLATFPRARDKTARSSRQRDIRLRRHSRGDGKDSPPSNRTPPEDAEDEFEDEDEEDGDDEEESDTEGIPPLDLDSMAGSEPIPSTVLKGRQLAEDEAILSPRNSFVLPDDDFVAEQEKLCSRFNERLSSPSGVGVGGGGMADHPRSQELRHTIASAKRKMRAYEESFERRYGYRASAADRAKDRDMKRCLAELSRARRDLKALRQQPPPPPLSAAAAAEDTLPPAGKENSAGTGSSSSSSTLQQTVADVMRRLSEKRQTDGRPTEPDCMSRDQVMAEKLALQKALLGLEERHGRPAHKRDRDVVRPLYERYRLVKRLAVKSGSPKLRDSVGELTPILEHETMSFTAADRPVICEQDGEMEPVEEPCGGATERLHQLPAAELRQLLARARQDKRQLRAHLLLFEEDFRCSVGRKVQKDDRGDMDDVYAEYKQVKARVKLLEVLLAKHRSRAYTM